MLSFTGGLKVFVAVAPCDLRKSFNGLQTLVSERLGEDLRQGALFVFTNRRHTRLKILYWDGTGVWLLVKRLEEGTFAWPKSVDPQTVKLRLAPEALAMLTDGIDLRGGRMRGGNNRIVIRRAVLDLVRTVARQLGHWAVRRCSQPAARSGLIGGAAQTCNRWDNIMPGVTTINSRGPLSLRLPAATTTINRMP